MGAVWQGQCDEGQCGKGNVMGAIWWEQCHKGYVTRTLDVYLTHNRCTFMNHPRYCYCLLHIGKLNSISL